MGPLVQEVWSACSSYQLPPQEVGGNGTHPSNSFGPCVCARTQVHADCLSINYRPLLPYAQVDAATALYFGKGAFASPS